MITSKTTLREQAFLICTAMDRSGTTCVLTGGSAATIYAPQEYQSQDMDFVVTFIGASGNEQAILTWAFGAMETCMCIPRILLHSIFRKGRSP